MERHRQVNVDMEIRGMEMEKRRERKGGPVRWRTKEKKKSGRKEKKNRERGSSMRRGQMGRKGTLAFVSQLF